MRITLALSVLFFVAGIAVRGEEPTLDFQVTIPGGMQTALKRFNPGFSVWLQADFLPVLVRLYRYSYRETPSAVVGDFNGDGTPDLALWGHDDKNNLLLVALSEGKEYRVVELARTPYTDPKTQWLEVNPGDRVHGISEYLNLVAKGKVQSSDPDAPHELASDAIEWGTFEKGSTVYYYRNGRFESYSSSD